MSDTTHLDLTDIQGNILRAYGRYGFPFARYYLLRVRPRQAAAARAFIERLRPRVTSAVRWQQGPNASAADAVPAPDETLNIAFSFAGLLALGLPTRTLARMPPEFIDGMARRGYILGDEGPSGVEHWDRVWGDSPSLSAKGDVVAADQADAERETEAVPGAPGHAASEMGRVHLWVSINARTEDHLDSADAWLRNAIDTHRDGIELLAGHGPDGADHQQAAALFVSGSDGMLLPTAREHFGFADGIGDPVFAGRYEPETEARRVKGRGKLLPDQTWAPIATGEFLLGQPDEAQELPPVAAPWDLTRNGSYMVYRKLHQNVASFHHYIAEQAGRLARVWDLSAEAAHETLRAKIVGRWTDGIPLIAAGTYAEWRSMQAQWSDIPALRAKRGQRTPVEQARLDAWDDLLSNFTFGDDEGGIKCPYGAHLRRVNTRDMLDPLLRDPDPKARTGSALNKRRHILRRGLPYGYSDPDHPSDDGEHGVIFMAICASLSRQFEFIQQQWIQYGLDFNVGNDTCPLVGNHLGDADTSPKYVLAADPNGDKPPYICANLPQFVTVRGGEYFFIPGLNGLRMIAEGSVDPT